MSTTTTTASVQFSAPNVKEQDGLPESLFSSVNEEPLKKLVNDTELLKRGFQKSSKGGRVYPRHRRVYRVEKGRDRAVGGHANDSLANGQDDALEDVEMTEAEYAEEQKGIEKMLLEGSDNAGDPQNVEVLQVPEDIALIYDLNVVWIRRSWERGFHPDLVARINLANQLIARPSPGEGRTEEAWVQNEGWKKYRFPGLELIHCVENVVQYTREFYARKREGNPTGEEAKNVGWSVLNMRRLLVRCDLRFKSVITPQAMDAMTEVLHVALQTIGGPHSQLLRDYLSTEEALPTRSQAVILGKAAPLFRTVFDNLEKGNDDAVNQAITGMSQFSKSLADLNGRLRLRADDHALPIPFLQAAIEACRNGESSSLKQKQFATYCEQSGFIPIAENVSAERLPIDALDEDTTRKIRELRLKHLCPVQQDLDEAAEREALVVQPRQDRQTDLNTTDTNLPTQNNPSLPSAMTEGGLENSQQSGVGVQPPVFETFPGPILEDGVTHFGKIMWIRKVGWGHRVIVNVGTDAVRVLKCFRGSDFGRNTIKDWMSDQGPLEAPTATLKSGHARRRPAHIYSLTDIIVADMPSGRIREPPTYFVVQWRAKMPGFEDAPCEELLTRSELISVLGKKLVDGLPGSIGYRQKLEKERQRKVDWLQKCNAENLHPDTGRPATRQDMKDIPWVFQEGFREHAEEFNDEDIRVGDEWTPPTG
ncbi:hypothetical protein KC318_g433 [Hortaea werneckii]|nr:hypothetical protein KC334_g401 [Hortaea werneckii]KAI7027344.1 hypothetical protein KC355_g368 [Hortaea werneckii]KAI7676188.1 hypothetical protein KC318_g433 [Hortaea werneckii]